MLPNRVWIKNEIYEVVFVREIDEPNDIGYCDDEKKILYIKIGLDKVEELDTFAHETLHAICHQHKIKLGHKTLDKLATAIVNTLIINEWIDVEEE